MRTLALPFSFLLGSAFAQAAPAAPIEQLKPMEFLAGHCWKGTFPNGKATDEHCFEWMVDGHALRDKHVVKAEGKPDYAGETIYYWDSEKKIVSYLYVENLGGFSSGTETTEGNALVFPAARYVDKGEAMVYRTRWTRGEDNSYEVVNEIQNKDQWIVAFKVKMLMQGGKS
jgi:hypothetical protein